MPRPAETLLALGFKEHGYDQWVWPVPGEYGLTVHVYLTSGLPQFSVVLPELVIVHETDPYLALASVRVLSTECRRAYDMLTRVAGLAQQIREGLDS